MARKFKDRGQNEIYDLYREDPPKARSSGGVAAAYWRGLDHPDASAPYSPTSLAHAAWSAGRTTARDGQRKAAA